MRMKPWAILGFCCLAVFILPPLHGAENAVPQSQVRQIKVFADKAPDCSSLKAIVASVTRGCTSNDEKAIALYNFMQLANYHQIYPGEPGGLGALKEINVYGWSLCGGLHTVEASLWRAACEHAAPASAREALAGAACSQANTFNQDSSYEAI